MALKEKGDFELVKIRLYSGDKYRLNEYYPEAGYNKVIRKLVHNHLSKLDAKLSQRLSAKSLDTNMEDYNGCEEL